MTEKLEEKIGKMAKLKANIRLVKRDNCAQIVPIYKA
jgi:hypothetical protein